MKPSLDENLAKPRVRLDKWLWAARFYQTRSQSSEAIAAGHVKVAGDRVKSGLTVHVGLILELVKESVRWEIEVLGLSEKRGKGADAALLYQETDDGKAKRIKQLEKQMLEYARGLEFEKAARIRDQLALLREQAFGGGAAHDSNVLPLVAGSRAKS